jgi:hypothetical protein
MRVFKNGLNPFKIQTKFKLELLLEFLIQNTEGYESWAEKESCSLMWIWSSQKNFINFEGPKNHVFEFQILDFEK